MIDKLKKLEILSKKKSVFCKISLKRIARDLLRFRAQYLSLM